MRHLLLSLVVLALACSCHRQAKVGAAAPDEQRLDSGVLRIAYVATLDALPFYVAQQRGLFAAVGLTVRLDRYAAQMDIDTALLGGSADGAFTDLVRVAQMARKDSLPLDIITLTAAQWTLVSNKVARLNTLEQMGDKMVAMTRFSATDYLTDRAFRDVKKAAPHFKVQINDVALRLRMLENNEMDAMWLPEPFATQALMEGHKELVRAEKYNLSLGVLALRHDKNNAQEQLREVYSMACDTINKYGVPTFADELQMFCAIDSATIHHLPPVTFAPATLPTNAILQEIENYLAE